MVETERLAMACRMAGPKDGPLLILLHGFPETSRCWAPIVDPLAEAGWRVVAPDQRGYGATGGPDEIEAYALEHLTADIAALIRALGRERAVVVGHDWGGNVAWGFGVLYPAMTRAVIGVNTPHIPPPPAPPTAILKKRYGQEHYMVAFQDPKAHEALDADPEAFLRLVFRKPERAPKDPPDAKTYAFFEHLNKGAQALPGAPSHDEDHLMAEVESFRENGFHRPLNWYRNLDANNAMMAKRDVRIHAPALWIGAAWDAFLPVSLSEAMVDLVPNLTRHVMAGCGHWTMHEAPEETAEVMVTWLAGLAD
jgi:pimeloyl-ACP methyl ester carboxylesterase